jgi:hypothetical protein
VPYRRSGAPCSGRFPGERGAKVCAIGPLLAPYDTVARDSVRSREEPRALGGLARGCAAGHFRST